MKDISVKIMEGMTGEKRHVVCVKDLDTKHLKFDKGSEWDATRINDEWWCIDAVGIKEKQFKTYFKNI